MAIDIDIIECSKGAAPGYTNHSTPIFACSPTSLSIKLSHEKKSGELVVFVSCVTMLYQLDDKRKIQDIAGSLRSIWVFAEVSLCTLLGATLAFDPTNGPNVSQRGISSELVQNTLILMILGSLSRLIGVAITVIAFLRHTFPTHRQQWSWLWRYIVNIWIYQLPRSTVQATLGSAAYTLRVFSGGQGLNKGFVVMEIAGFIVLVYAPIGAWMTKTFGYSLSATLATIDVEQGWHDSKMKAGPPSQSKLVHEDYTDGSTRSRSKSVPHRNRSNTGKTPGAGTGSGLRQRRSPTMTGTSTGGKAVPRHQHHYYSDQHTPYINSNDSSPRYRSTTSTGVRPRSGTSAVNNSSYASDTNGRNRSATTKHVRIKFDADTEDSELTELQHNNAGGIASIGTLSRHHDSDASLDKLVALSKVTNTTAQESSPQNIFQDDGAGLNGNGNDMPPTPSSVDADTTDEVARVSFHELPDGGTRMYDVTIDGDSDVDTGIYSQDTHDEEDIGSDLSDEGNVYIPGSIYSDDGEDSLESDSDESDEQSIYENNLQNDPTIFDTFGSVMKRTKAKETFQSLLNTLSPNLGGTLYAETNQSDQFASESNPRGRTRTTFGMKIKLPWSASPANASSIYKHTSNNSARRRSTTLPTSLERAFDDISIASGLTDEKSLNIGRSSPNSLNSNTANFISIEEGGGGTRARLASEMSDLTVDPMTTTAAAAVGSTSSEFEDDGDDGF